MRLVRVLGAAAVLVAQAACRSASNAGGPTVVDTQPAQGGPDYLVGGVINATFSEDMDAASVDAQSFLVTAGTNPVPGTASYASRVATFVPASVLTPGSSYQVTLTTALRSVDGAHLAQPYTWTFRSADLSGWHAPERIGSTSIVAGKIHPVVFGRPWTFAAWEHVGTQHTEIRVAAFNPSSPGTWSTEVALDSGVGDADRPEGAVGNASAVLVWSQGGTLYASRYASNASWSPPEAVSDAGTAPDPGRYRVGSDTSGDAVVVWSSLGAIYRSERMSTGQGWSAPTRVDTGGGENPAVSVNAFGGATVVWERAAVVYGATGTIGSGWGQEQAISTGAQVEPSGGKLRPDVIDTLYDGTFVTWAGAVTTPSSSTHVRARRWSAGVWDPEVTVWSVPGLWPDPAPRLAPLGGPDFLASWSVRGSPLEAGVAVYTSGSWIAPEVDLPAGEVVRGAIESQYQTPPASALATANGPISVYWLASPSSTWSATQVGEGDAAALGFDVFGRLIVVWSGPVGTSGVYTIRQP